MGWNIIQQIARFHDVWVMTTDENRQAIIGRLDHETAEHLHVQAFDLPRVLRWLQKIPGGIQCYAYLWQLGIYPLAKRLHREHRMDYFHHVTYANDWMASVPGALLPVPFIRGPGGGAQRVPRAFLQEYTWQGRTGERLRQIGQWVFRCDPLYLRGQALARLLLLCNRESLAAVPARWRAKALPFPVNGISRDDLGALGTPRPQRDGPMRVLTAGKLIRLKGFSLAIKAFHQFLSAGEGTLDIIGDGPDRAYLEGLVESLGLRGRVRIISWMPRREFLEALKTCDVFLFPSFRDGGGAVVIEAMAAGRPVICLDLGGPGLHVTETCGIKVQPGPVPCVVQDLAAALERFACDPQLRTVMGQEARRRAETAYHWDRLGERLIKLYQGELPEYRDVALEQSHQPHELIPLAASCS